MDINMFDFDLPEELIAQTPSKNRSESRLLVVDKQEIKDRHFYDIINYFNKGAARLFGTKEETGAHVEVLILKVQDDVAECLVGNAKVVKVGTVVSFGDGRLKAKCLEVKE